jgi:hypothetical protein
LAPRAITSAATAAVACRLLVRLFNPFFGFMVLSTPAHPGAEIIVAAAGPLDNAGYAGYAGGVGMDG